MSPHAHELARRSLTAARAAAAASPRRDTDDGRSGALLLLAVPVGLVVWVVLVIALLAGALEQECASTTSAAASARPGALGGVAGTGLTRAEIDAVRARSPYASARLQPGEYIATSYGPPWGGIQGHGSATSGGLAINGGRPRWYMIAVDPALIGHGQLVHAWPNPFAWTGPFLAADTGAAIQQHRIDFYDWRGRGPQRTWGRRTTTLIPADLGTDAAGALASAGCPNRDETKDEPALALPGVRGQVTVAALANAPGKPIRPELHSLLASVAGIAGRALIVTTGTNHSLHTSSGRISDHVLGLAADFGSIANHFPLGDGFGTRLAAAALRAGGLPDSTAWQLARSGGGHNVCHHGWRVQVIWRTGDHHDHVHIGLRQGCAFTGVQTFQI
jgi:3D (Asp-Asp-Asp) domain-containing protein